MKRHGERGCEQRGTVDRDGSRHLALEGNKRMEL